MTNHMIGKVLQGRYQVVQALGAGVFGETYIAVDIENLENPKYVIKQLKVISSQPSYLQTLRLRFITETETLRQLGHHKQIPQLISCFEEHERFYLVQEFVEGHALTAELPINLNLGHFWSESEVINFLQDVLSILDFVHSQGVIHCDIKPENLIRRACDNKLVLIDFGSIQSIDFEIIDEILPLDSIPVSSLGYIPPEQFIGLTQPNSDIYSLGMIAIQALTGVTPLQLKVDPQTNEILWRSASTPVSDYLAAIITQMTRYNYEERFQSARVALRALQQMPFETQYSYIVDVDFTVSEEDCEKNQPESKLNTNPKHSISLNSSPLLTGMKVGLVANSLVMGFGTYFIIHNTPTYSEKEALYKATEEYQSGDLDGAIALAKSIPSNSNVYPDAQASIEEWQKQWQNATQQYQAAEKAFQENRWSDVLRATSQLPDILYWQTKTDKLVQQAQVNIEAQTQDLLTKAYEKASLKDFSSALDYLSQIPEESSAGAIVQQKLAEYNHKKSVRAAYFLQKAYNKAAEGDFKSAVQFLQQVPKDTPVYATAQVKLVEYTQKQQIVQAKNQKIASSKAAAFTNMKKPLSSSNSARNLESFDLSHQMEEVNIR
ncbi:MAG: protein kinase [Brasilonema octagenarum HA4186-MV1]|uniref:non-specific serine/threonine protein kinase n=2 Tax=Brasilonema TaxID=383614 RepID=A0A856MIU9_9CYAN|nr:MULTISPECIES: serine/threonine-protein kinase [Brasilonema]MBW4625149.1 protein kinase [Brasilonema octagenarum HA4186-MV1]NMF61786.1 serine/threonine protein kinase [Brasilonema octagenarum UFV-OR1]QDL09571.1 serine/threonine protein kinase [Brasilonema sennae CENA114]QDL15926.1 serine/threonine protein kinase [Brasilonema octagenarum UFV-E1]